MSRFMEKKILTVLLDSYERSRLFREGGSARRIQFRPMEREDFAELAEKSDARREFLDTAEELAAEGLIEYDWVRYEEGNLIDRIFLRTEEAAVRLRWKRFGAKGGSRACFSKEKRIRNRRRRLRRRMNGCCSFSSFLRGMKTNFWSGWSAPDCMGTASTLSASFGARSCPFCAGSRRMAMRRN